MPLREHSKLLGRGREPPKHTTGQATWVIREATMGFTTVCQPLCSALSGTNGFRGTGDFQLLVLVICNYPKYFEY